MEEKIIRPTTKPEAIKGKLLKYQGTDYCEFLPNTKVTVSFVYFFCFL